MVCLLALAGKAALDWEYERVKAAAAAVAAANDAKAQELWDQFRAARDALFAKRTVDDALAIIKRDPTSDRVEDTPNGPRRVVVYDAPELRANYRFIFATDNPLGNWSANGGKSGGRLLPAVPRSAIQRGVSTLARWLVFQGWPICFLPWIGLLVWSRRVPAHRPWLGWAMTAWACFCATAFVCGFGSLFNIRVITSNSGLAWSGLMLLLSAVVIVWHARVRDGDPLACVACGYHLAGNTSGVCPECGGTIDADKRQRIEAMGVAGGWR
jgi:hypothetical protein